MSGEIIGALNALPMAAEEYVRDNAQTYLDLQMGAVIVICLTILIALLPIALGVWGAFQKSVFFVIVAVVAAGIIVWGGLAFANGLAARGAATIGTKSIEGVVTAVQSKSELSSIGLDTQSRVLLVRAEPDLLSIGDYLKLECSTINGAIALSTPCDVIDG